MTEVRYKHKSKSFELTVTGHAEFSQNKEPDIVCSAISALSHTLASMIEELSEKRVFRRIPIVKIESGNVVIKVRAQNDIEEQIKNYFELTAYGLKLIALEYPKNVSFEKI